MIYINTFLYYTLFSSVVLIYGIGINRIAEVGVSKFFDFIYYVKSAFSIFFTSIASWFIVQYILIPLNLIEIYPLICLVVFITISSFLEALVRLTTGITSTEFVVSFLVVLLSITESTSIANTILICLSSFTALLLLIPLSLTFKKRVCSNGHFLDEKYYCLFFIFLAIIILAMSTPDFSWLNSEVIQ